MSFPLVIYIGHHPIMFHLITDFLSMTLGGILYWKMSKGDGITYARRQYLLIGTGIGALIGSRLIGSLENISLFLNPPSLLYYYASKTVIGGIVGGILGMEAAKLIIGHKSSTGDKITTPLIIAIIIGRIGCLFTGVSDGTVGNVCDYSWCINQGDGLLRHPTSLYEILFLIMVLLLIIKIKDKLRNGVLFRSFISLYFLFRFLIEFIKPINPIIFSLSIIQIVCLLYIFWYTYDIYRINSKYGNRK